MLSHTFDDDESQTSIPSGSDVTPNHDSSIDTTPTMASVSSLDNDMRNLRMSRYTPQTANEARTWIESTLGESIASGDLLEALKDGVALCKLANLVLPSPGIKFKQSPMPFIQMENISHFLKACEMPPLSMPAHDRFLTVDLYEGKDPAQVLQCLGAFSRQAHAARPDVVKSTIGPRKAGGATMSPSSTGGGANGYGSFRTPSPTKPSAAMPGSGRTMSPSLTGGSTGSQGNNSKSPTVGVSSWSRKEHEGSTLPAWNIAQYGYMGGASQGNQGISFGSRRQITSQAPSVPSLAEKERVRKEKAAEEERQRQQAEEDEQRRRAEREAEEEQERIDEERRWEEETRRQREEEKRSVEDQKRQWAEQEKRWKEEEEVRRKEAAEMNAMTKKPPEKPRVPSSGILRGQTLSEWQREQSNGKSGSVSSESPEQRRVKELEKQLEEARERERQYQAEREERLRRENERSRPSSSQTETARPQSSAEQSDASWVADERDYLRKQWQSSQENTPAKPANAQGGAQRVPSEPKAAPSLPSRPLPQPSVEEPSNEEKEEELPAPPPPQRAQPSASASSLPKLSSDSAPNSSPLGTPNRPLPTPDKEYTPYTPSQPQQTTNRTDRFLSTNPVPAQTGPRISSSQEAGDTALEQSRLRDNRIASQNKTKAGGWASKSLLEREMERERERQREWEQNQQATKSAARDANEGSGEGKSWDVNQYGYMGGDSQNSGSGPGSGISFGGRRQILGPRSMAPSPGGSRRGQ